MASNIFPEFGENLWVGSLYEQLNLNKSIQRESESGGSKYIFAENSIAPLRINGYVPKGGEFGHFKVQLFKFYYLNTVA